MKSDREDPDRNSSFQNQIERNNSAYSTQSSRVNHILYPKSRLLPSMNFQPPHPRRANTRRRTVSPQPQSQSQQSLSQQQPQLDAFVDTTNISSSQLSSSTQTPSAPADTPPLTALETPPQSKGKSHEQQHRQQEEGQQKPDQEPQQQAHQQNSSSLDSPIASNNLSPQDQQTNSPLQVSIGPSVTPNNIGSIYLSPCSSQTSSRSSLSLNSPVQIRINPAACSARRSLNYEISMIQEKRFEDERNAINYAEKVLKMNEKQTPSFKKHTPSSATRNPASVFLLSSPQPTQLSNTSNANHTNNLTSILKKKAKPATAETEERNVSLLSEDASHHRVNTSASKDRSNRLLDVDFLGRESFTWNDRKSLSKITRVNTERNSIIQPVENIGDHELKLLRCNLHSKRVRDLYCTEESCQEKNKFGCVLCFSSNAGSAHSFHAYQQISSMDQLNQRIKKNRRHFLDFVTSKAETISSTIISQTTEALQKKLKQSLLEYVGTLEDREFFDDQVEDEDSNSSEEDENSNNSNIKKVTLPKTPKEVAVQVYLAAIEKQTSNRIAQISSFWIEQSYLGVMKDEDTSSKFQREKKRNLLTFSNCFHRVSTEIIALYLNSPKVAFDTPELENASLNLHFIEDEISFGVYQIADNSASTSSSTNAAISTVSAPPTKKIRSGRGIQCFKSGSLFEGYYKNDHKQGEGKFISFNRDVYIGTFKRNLRSGEGSLTYANGDIYTGTFLNDQCHGTGKREYITDGLTYVGQWVKNQRHGKGQMLKDGKVIESGTYVDDHLRNLSKK